MRIGGLVRSAGLKTHGTLQVGSNHLPVPSSFYQKNTIVYELFKVSLKGIPRSRSVYKDLTEPVDTSETNPCQGGPRPNERTNKHTHMQTCTAENWMGRNHGTSQSRTIALLVSEAVVNCACTSQQNRFMGVYTWELTCISYNLEAFNGF